MQYLLIVFSVLAGSSKSLLSKGLHSVNGDRLGLSRSNTYIFSAALVSVLILSCIFGFGGLSLFTLGLGLIFACVLTAGQMLYMEALAAGEVSVTAFLYSCGFLIPTVAGVIFWKEAVTVQKVIGVLLLLVSFFLIAWAPKKDGSRSSGTLRWRVCAFSAMAMSGLLGVLQKVHQTSAHKGELGSFLTVAMCAAVLFSALLAHFSAKGAQRVPFPRKIQLTALSCGAIYGLANFVNLRLAGVIPATLQFPLVNGGTIVFTALMGHLLFRESLSRRKLCGILVGIAAIIIISR